MLFTTVSLEANDLVIQISKELYLRIRTQIATKEYASRVPMDMRSTRAARSKKKAIKAGKRNKRNCQPETENCNIRLKES